MNLNSLSGIAITNTASVRYRSTSRSQVTRLRQFIRITDNLSVASLSSVTKCLIVIHIDIPFGFNNFEPNFNTNCSLFSICFSLIARKPQSLLEIPESIHGSRFSSGKMQPPPSTLRDGLRTTASKLSPTLQPAVQLFTRPLIQSTCVTLPYNLENHEIDLEAFHESEIISVVETMKNKKSFDGITSHQRYSNLVPRPCCLFLSGTPKLSSKAG